MWVNKGWEGKRRKNAIHLYHDFMNSQKNTFNLLCCLPWVNFILYWFFSLFVSCFSESKGYWWDSWGNRRLFQGVQQAEFQNRKWQGTWHEHFNDTQCVEMVECYGSWCSHIVVIHVQLVRYMSNIWRIIYLNCGERYEDMFDHRSYTVAKLKPEKNSGLIEICTHDLCKRLSERRRRLKFRLLQYWCSALPTKLSSQLRVGDSHFKYVIYLHTMWPAPRWLDSSFGRALHWYRRGHGLECFSGVNFKTAQVVYVTAVISDVFSTCLHFFSS